METKRKYIEPGMLIYETPPQVIQSRIDKEGCYVLSKAKMKRLKEVIEPYLQRKDDWCKRIYDHICKQIKRMERTIEV